MLFKKKNNKKLRFKYKIYQNVAYHIHDHLGVCLPLVVGEGDVKVGHGPQDRHQGLDRVRVHHGPKIELRLSGPYSSTPKG